MSEHVKSLRDRALEALATHDRRTAEDDLQRLERDRVEMAARCRVLAAKIGIVVPEGQDALVVEGLTLSARRSRYGVILVPGAACRECGEVGELQDIRRGEGGIQTLEQLGAAYRTLEELGDRLPCDFVGPRACARMKAASRGPRPARPTFSSPAEERLFGILEAAERDAPPELTAEERAVRNARVVMLEIGAELEETAADRELATALRRWLTGELEARG